jgi:hypothetical protein
VGLLSDNPEGDPNTKSEAGAPAPVSTFWYETVTDISLRQGDFFRNILVFWLPAGIPIYEVDPTEVALDLKFDRGDWIVMSASCDVARSSPSQVVMGRVLPADEKTLGAKSANDLRDRLEVLRKGFDPLRFLLAECQTATPPFPRSFVQFRTQVALPADYLQRQCAEPRLRLRSPFRESFGSWVGGNFGRVGVEDHTQIPADKKGFAGAAQILRTAEGE